MATTTVLTLSEARDQYGVPDYVKLLCPGYEDGRVIHRADNCPTEFVHNDRAWTILGTVNGDPVLLTKETVAN